MKFSQINGYRLLILVFALAMALAGCSNGGNNDNAASSPSAPADSGSAPASASSSADTELPPVTLTWYYGVNQQQPDQQEVEDAVNDYLQKNTNLNVTLKLKPIDFGSYDQKMNVTIASGEPMDIVWTTASWLLKYNENVEKGAFLALDDLLPQYAPKTYNDMMPERFWEDVKASSDGKIYAIPNYQVAATAWGFLFQKRFVDKYNFDITQVKSYKDLEPFLKTLKENEPDVIPFAYVGGSNALDDPDLRDYDHSVTYNVNDPFTNIDKFSTPQYKDYLTLLHDWYDKGYIYPDIATVKDANAFYQKGNVAVSVDVTFKPGGNVEWAKTFGNNEMVSQQIGPTMFTGVSATMNAISKTSKNPERALMLLERVNTDKDLYRLLCYGIKGKHYNEADGMYEPVDNSGYDPQVDWVFGDQFNGLVRPGQPADVFEQTIKLNEDADVAPMNGFHFNSTALKTEMAAVDAVKAEYRIPLETGTVDPAVTLPKFLDALKKAGYDKIQTELNKQLADWAAANGKG